MRTQGSGRESERHGAVLLTGVTGFVGKRLLVELLEQTSCSIVCLVRAANELEAQRRGRALSKDLRVVFVPSDLEEPRLGLTHHAWKMLASRVVEIFHCAASVSFDLPLAESRRINVTGTRSLLDLAQAAMDQGQFRRFHHVSTAYVAGKKAGRVDSDYLPNHSNPRNFRNPYEQSKAEAEALLRAQTRVPVSIYRPSIVAGDTRSGETDNFNVLYVPMRLIRRGALPYLPAGFSSRVDCVGVDYVVQSIVFLSKAPMKGNASFHLTAGDDCFKVRDLVTVSNEETLRVDSAHTKECRTISRTGWNALRLQASITQFAPERFKGLRRWGKIVARGIRGFVPYEPYTSVGTIFDCVEVKTRLAAENISHPAALDYLRTITRYAMQADFGARSVNSESASDRDGHTGSQSEPRVITAGLQV